MLKFLPLFFASLRRKPIRTSLTIASIIVAFLLFGLLKTMQGALELGADLAGVDRLATMHKMSLIQNFPLAYLNRIRGVDGVVAAAGFVWMGGIYQDERNQLAAQATEPEAFLEVYPEYKLTPEQRADWLSDRTSMIAGKSVAERFRWKVGDTVPVRSSFYRKADGGGDTWEMRLVGIYETTNGDNQSIFFHYDYLNEALPRNGGRDSLVWIITKIRNPDEAQRVSAAVDALFANSPAETKTGTERAFIQGFANQMGDIATIVTAVASAVFFTMLLVTANTMAQSVRERTNEIAVLKTLGYTKQTIAGLVLTESFLITALGGVVGLGLAALFTDSIADLLAQFFPVVGIPTSAYVTGAVLIVVLSLLAGLLPSMEASRLKITDALRKV
ncbi:MAG TPA: FtsX-like permease family protein [Gammaproteobacteria bacterium]